MEEKAVKSIDLSDSQSVVLREAETKMTSLGLQHSSIRARFLKQERQMMHEMDSAQADFKKTVKRIFKKKGFNYETSKIKDIDYQNKKIIFG